MNRSTGNATRVGPLTSVVLFTLTASGMGAAALAVSMDSDNAAATPFGRVGVIILAGLTILLSAFSLVALLRGTAWRYRKALGYLLILAMFSAAVLAYYFFASGAATGIVGYMPAQAAVGLALTGQAVLAAGSERRGR
ncbi:hypothetical protein [Actinoplanes sp. CA-252034]|uniref:hypothetical protein n=1 Tax=Actinoplanes sp. CA-252034 TaxID=3239906 RepID=UPI003D96C333